MKFKKLLITGIALLGLACFSGVNANASGYLTGDVERASMNRSYATRTMKLYRWSNSNYFARIHITGHAWIHRGEQIGVTPFYHMGRDGFIVYIPNRNGIFYARTLSHKWYETKRPHRSYKQNIWSHATRINQRAISRYQRKLRKDKNRHSYRSIRKDSTLLNELKREYKYDIRMK